MCVFMILKNPTATHIFSPPHSPSPHRPAHWTLVWDFCPKTCPDWDHWRTPISHLSPPRLLPLSAPSPVLTHYSPPPPSPSPPPRLPVRVKPMRVEAFLSMTFAPGSDPARPAAGLCLHPPETSITVQLVLHTPSSASLLSPLRTSTSSLPSPTAPVTVQEPRPSEDQTPEDQTPEDRPEPEPLQGSMGSQNPSLLWGPCTHHSRGPQVRLYTPPLSSSSLVS